MLTSIMDLDELLARIKQLPPAARDRITQQLTEIVLREALPLGSDSGGAAAGVAARPARRSRGDGAGSRARRKPAPNTRFIEWWDRDERSAADIATELGVSKPALYQWRSGRTRPSIDKRAKLEKLSAGAVPADSWQ